MLSTIPRLYWAIWLRGRCSSDPATSVTRLVTGGSGGHGSISCASSGGEKKGRGFRFSWRPVSVDDCEQASNVKERTRDAEWRMVGC